MPGAKKRKIELLAPARDCEAGRAAIDFGADALYIGGPQFGARTAAANDIDAIARLVQYAHGFGVRVYATLNTLVYEDELARAQQVARELVAAGVDALIIQDMAFLRMGLDGVELHASTQMRNFTPQHVRFLQEAGFSRVILERGLTLQQIRDIRAATDVPLEVFVHGAICVGYSGQCYMSRSTGARSGNRGQCAQPCRLPYDLLDGTGRKVVHAKHLLSLRDLNLSGRIPELLAAGVDSFKIEGRLKDISYVKNVVTHYRRQIDLAMDSHMTRSSAGRTTTDFESDPSRSFSRGATSYYFDGKMAGAAAFDTPKAVGTPVGRVTSIGLRDFTIDSTAELAPGDGICFFKHDGSLSGTNINSVDGHRVRPGRMDGIARGTEIYRNHDHAFERMLASSRTRRLIAIDAMVEFRPDSIMELRLRDEDGFEVSAAIDCRGFEPANDHEKMVQTIRTQIGKSGDMPFEVVSVEIGFDAGTNGIVPFIPVARLNAMRREAMEKLWVAKQSARPRSQVAVEDKSFPYPSDSLDGSDNVTNSLSAQFYRDHGVKQIAPGHDLAADLAGVEVMRTPYCIRREIGQCLLERHTLQGPLELRSGRLGYRLEFDCSECIMKVITKQI